MLKFQSRARYEDHRNSPTFHRNANKFNMSLSLSFSLFDSRQSSARYPVDSFEGLIREMGEQGQAKTRRKVEI